MPREALYNVIQSLPSFLHGRNESCRYQRRDVLARGKYLDDYAFALNFGKRGEGHGPTHAAGWFFGLALNEVLNPSVDFLIHGRWAWVFWLVSLSFHC